MTSTRARRHALLLVLAVLAWSSALFLAQLQDRLGPHRQRVNVRFGPNVTDEARQQLEQQLGLRDGEERVPRTWTYRLADRSPATIATLLRSPLVEDTAHIDRETLRVVLDLPGVHPWVRELLQQERLPLVAWLLLAVGVVLAWSARGGVWAAARWLVRWCRADAPDIPWKGEVLIGLALCALFLAPLLLYGPADDEEGALGIFSSQIYYRDLLRGHWSYWFTNLGFGTPMPIGHRLDFHPVFGLGSLISLRVALSGLWILQVGVMAVYVWRLLAAGGLGSRARLVFLGLYLFSAVSFFNFYTTDWVSCVVPWTLYPVIVYYLRDACMGGAAARWWPTTVRLGALFSVWVLNAHPGYLAPLAIVLAAYVLAAAPRSVAVYGALATAGMFALAASAERIYYIVSERNFFPPDIVREAQAGYSPLSYLTTTLTVSFTNIEDMRQPFVGVFVLGAALAATGWWRVSDRHARGCIVAFLTALTMSLVPLEHVKWTGLSGVWLFRDPLVFFGLLSAAIVARSGLRDHRRAVRATVVALLLVQTVQQAGVLSTGFRAYWERRGRLQFYRHQGHPTGIGQAMVQAASRYGSRLYLSALAQRYSRGRLSYGGVHLLTDYALLGLNPVNGWFKNVSMDRIHPSSALMNGFVVGQQAVIDNGVLLDVLGIDLVVAMTQEHLAPEGLTRTERLMLDTEIGVDIFANPDAWPKAVLLSADARNVALPIVDGCGHTGALCRDYASLAATRLPQDVTVREVRDGYVVHVPPSDAPRLLFISAFYRPEWVATAGDQALAIEPIAGAFIGVAMPPGIQDVQLAFRPRTRIVLTWLSGATLCALLVAFGAMTRRRIDAASRDAQ